VCVEKRDASFFPGSSIRGIEKQCAVFRLTMHGDPGMSGKWRLIGLLVILTGLGGASTLGATPTRDEVRDKEPREEVTQISLQISALQILYLLKSTPEQLETLSKLAGETAPKPQARKQASVSGKHRKILTDLRKALLDADDDKITKLSEELKELQDKEEVDLDDAVQVVEAARKRLPEVLRLYNARQLANYVGSLGDDFPDPVDRLNGAFLDSRTLSGDDWTKVRKQVSETLGWLVAGRDADASAMVAKEVASLLEKAHDLDEDDYKKQREDLQAAGKKLVGQVEPIEVIRHFLEREAAELLSNPELPRVLEERLKKVKREK
jgi:hypothetical protein